MRLAIVNESMRRHSATVCAAASRYSSLIALINNSRILISSSVDNSILHSIQLDSAFASRCKFLEWFPNRNSLKVSNDSNPSTLRLLVADDDRIQVYDAADAQWSASISGASKNAGKIVNVEFGNTPDEVLVFSDFGVKATLWSLVSRRGVEFRDPKLSTRGHCLRPLTGHLAMLMRETVHDTLIVVAPKTNELIGSFVLATTDAQGIKWSPDGRWISTWDAASAGYAVLLYTADGHLFKTFYGWQSLDRPSLGVRNVEWDPSGRFVAIGSNDNDITLLSSDKFSQLAIFQHAVTVESTRAEIWQEQIDAAKARSYVRASQAVCPSAVQSQSNDSIKPTGISHLTFNTTGTLLATRSDATPTTVWVWNTSAFAPVAILIHHSATKTLQWSPNDPSILLIHCIIADPVVHLFHPSWPAPRILNIPSLRPGGRKEASWVHTPSDSTQRFMLSTANSYVIKSVDGNDDVPQGPTPLFNFTDLRPGFSGLGPEDMFDEGNSMDLSPIKLSTDHYTRMGAALDESGVGETTWNGSEEIDDTFNFRKVLRNEGS